MAKYNCSENRKRPRVPLDNRLLCFQLYDYTGRLKTEDLPIIISLRDISYGGIGAASATKLELGDTMTINLTHGIERCTFDLQVVWCHYNLVYYEMGFMFKSLTKKQVLFLDAYIKDILKVKRKQRY